MVCRSIYSDISSRTIESSDPKKYDAIAFVNSVLPTPVGPENMKLAIGCVFCGYKEHCWSDANQGRGLRKFKYSTGIRNLTQVHKTPDVEEVTNAFA